MTETAAAHYFDGQSSASHPAQAVFHDTMNELRFELSNGASFVWQVDDIQYERYKNVVEIRNGKYAGAILKMEDMGFAQHFHEAMLLRKPVDVHTQLLNLGLSKITFIALFLLGLIVLTYFYVLPPAAEKAAALLPGSFDNELGDIFMETFMNESNIDTIKTNYLTQFAAGLNLENDKPLRFTVVASKEVNAFALPNGQIVVFSAILDSMKSYEALVALLGHEASHVNHRHSVKMLCRNLAGYLTVSLLFSDVNGVMAVLADNAQQLHSLSYSRKFEQEADEQGLKILMDNHIDPNGMLQLFEQLESASKFTIPQILSSHPLTKERKSHMQEIIAESVYEVKPNDGLSMLFEQLKN